MSAFTRARLLFECFLTLGIASWIGAGAGLLGLLGGQTNTGQQQNTSGLNAFGMGNLSAGLNNNLTAFTAALPNWVSSYQNTAGIPTGGLINAGNTAGSMASTLGGQATNYGNLIAGQYPSFIGMGNNLIGAGNTLYNTAMDPQGALYNQLLNTVQERAGATNAQYGQGGSPVGAGVQNDAIRNFLINWQNQQLGRQATGVQGLEGAYGAGANLFSQGANTLGQGLNVGALGPQFTMQGGQLPVQAQEQAYAIPGEAASQYYSNLYGADVAPYLGAATMGGSYNTSQTQNPFLQQVVSSNALYTGLNNIGDSGGGTVGNWLTGLLGAGNTDGGGGTGTYNINAFGGQQITPFVNTYGNNDTGETSWMNALLSGLGDQ